MSIKNTRALMQDSNVLPLEEAQAINRAWREKAVDSAGFFDRAIDEQYLSQVRQDLAAILGLPSDS